MLQTTNQIINEDVRIKICGFSLAMRRAKAVIFSIRRRGWRGAVQFTQDRKDLQLASLHPIPR